MHKAQQWDRLTIEFINKIAKQTPVFVRSVIVPAGLRFITSQYLKLSIKVIAEVGLAGMSGVWEGGYKKVVKGSPPKTVLKDII